LYLNPLTRQDRQIVDPNVTFAYPLNALPDNNSAVKLFGQSAILKVNSIRAYSKPDNAELEVAKVNN